MEYIAIALSAVTVVLAVILLIRQSNSKKDDTDERLQQQFLKMQADIQTEQRELRRDIADTLQASVRTLGELLAQNQKQASDASQNAIRQFSDTSQNSMKQLEERLKSLESNNEQKLEAMRETITRRLSYIQTDNNAKLEKIRETVDEKLQKTLEEKMNQSFERVSRQLEEVYKGLGEMQTLATGVGDLKKVLSNVKTRGIMGEFQLGAILQEILAPEQYEENVATIPGSSNRVEFAVKLPGEDGAPVYLPIDSKFPGDAYEQLQDAYDSGSPEAVNAAFATLSTRIRAFAKDIHDKYIEEPYTTNFGIMFLPFEGLYAEVVNRGMVEPLQRDYNVNVAGPSTMAALLNSLQMGFKTLAIQKRSSEVWKILGAVKSEFAKFDEVLAAAQLKIERVGKDLDKLVGTRTRAINRRLREVQSLSSGESAQLLELGAAGETDEE